MTYIINDLGDVTLGEEDRAAALAELKAALTLVSSDDDALLAFEIEAALSVAERFIGRAMIARDLVERLPASAAWQALGAGPVASIDMVEMLNGATPMPLVTDEYAIDIDADATGWVRIVGGGDRVIDVHYRAGWAEQWSHIAAPIRQGVVMLAAHLYSTRGSDVPPPMAVMALWRPFRAATLTLATRA